MVKKKYKKRKMKKREWKDKSKTRVIPMTKNDLWSDHP